MKNYVEVVFVTILSFSVLQSCGGGDDGSTVQEKAPSNSKVKEILYPTIIANESSEPNTVEVTLTAEQTLLDYGTGSKTVVWSYNGVIPGPTIEAKVGDKVIVHLINKLNEATTIHFHGVELSATMDGSTISQLAVEPGTTFTYSFTVKRAATYWYHPHVRSNVQVEKGLYGSLIVRDLVEDRQLNLPTKEHLLVLDDVKLDFENQIKPEFSDVPIERALEMLNGREGNVLLVNGQINPKIKIKRGVPNRFRVINASNTRFMRISILNHNLWRIGGDAGLIPRRIDKQHITAIPNPSYDPNVGQPEYYSDPNPELGILLTPGERAEFIFTPKSNEKFISLNWHDINRGRHIAVPVREVHGTPTVDGFILEHDDFDGVMPDQRLATFELYGEQSSKFYIPPLNLRPTAAIDESQVTGKPITIIYGHTQPDANGNVDFFIKAKMAMNPNFDPALPITPSNTKMLMEKPLPFSLVTPDIADMVKPNETRIIEITNMTGGDHNFHLHGFMFQLLDTKLIYDDAPEKNITIPASFAENKDTIIVPRRPGKMKVTRSVIRLIVKFDNTGREILASGKQPTAISSGGWIMHCHFLEHSARGMMSYIQVTP